MRILLIEDHDRFAELLRALLERNGYSTDRVSGIAEAQAALAVVAFDGIVLDLGLADGDGIDLVRAIRRSGNGIPVLAATARSGLTAIVKALDDGIDDYLVKPFAPEELLARLRALLRRPRQVESAELTAGNVVLDTTARAVRVEGRPLAVPPREFHVLATLLRSQGRVTPRDRLENAVYTLDDAVTPNAIEAVVSRLRRRLEVSGATVAIEAMRGLGYVVAERP